MYCFILQEIAPEEVTAFPILKAYSAPRIGGIPSKFVKLARCILSLYLAKLFNKRIEQEILPRDFKTVYVIPILSLLLLIAFLNSACILFCLILGLSVLILLRFVSGLFCEHIVFVVFSFYVDPHSN